MLVHTAISPMHLGFCLLAVPCSHSFHSGISGKSFFKGRTPHSKRLAGSIICSPFLCRLCGRLDVLAFICISCCNQSSLADVALSCRIATRLYTTIRKRQTTKNHQRIQRSNRNLSGSHVARYGKCNCNPNRFDCIAVIL